MEKSVAYIGEIVWGNGGSQMKVNSLQKWVSYMGVDSIEWGSFNGINIMEKRMY